jgi:chromosome segregation ATPase
MRGKGKMTANEEIVFDKSCGISVEEQRDILSRINGIAEKNRRSLSEGSKAGITRFKAKKSGSLFPALVNITAVLILAGGAFLLFYFNKKNDITIREGDKTYSSAEHALIVEIRKDTAFQIESKEKEIASIQSKLDDVDNRLKLLLSGNAELTREQLDAREELLSLQNAYRLELASSYQEMAQILEDSRFREARLRAQFEESAAVQRQTSEELNSALSEIERIGKEQDRAAAIDSYIAGSLKLIHGYINKNQISEAAVAARDLYEFLETGAFQSIRTYAARKEMYLQAVSTIELMIKDALASSSGVLDSITLDELNARNAGLEQVIKDTQITLDSLNAGNSKQTARLTELESSLDLLRNEKSTLESGISERNRTINSLQSERAERDRTISSLQSERTERDRTISGLQSERAERDRTINVLQSDKTELERTITARDSSIRDLQSRANTQAAEIVNLNNQLATIRQLFQQAQQTLEQ